MKANKVKAFCTEHKDIIVKSAAAVGTVAVATLLITLGVRKRAAKIYKLDGVVVYD